MENNDLLTFTNPEFGKVRSQLINSEPWFLAADVCRALEISNPSQAITRLDDDEKNTVRISDGIQGRGNPNVNVISEPAVYKLVFRSNKPEAKAFLRWVTHDVLPKIMRSGSLFSRSVQLADDFSSLYNLAAQMSITDTRKSFWNALMTAFNTFNNIVNDANYDNRDEVPRSAAIYDANDLSLLRSILSSAEKVIYGKIRNLREKQELLQQLTEF